MTAALQRSFSSGGKRVDFSAQTFPLGDSPLDREALTPEQIAALHKVVEQAQLMATNLSFESMAGLTSLLKSISGLRQALKGTQTATIRAAASNLRDDLNVLKSANPNNPQLALTLSALKNIVPEKTKTGQVIRLAVVRDSKIAQPMLGVKIIPDGRTTGAKVIPFGKAAAQAGHAERLVPSKPSPLRHSNITGKADLSVLAKPELKQTAIPAKEPIGKADPVSGKAMGLTSVDKKLSATAVTTQKDNLTTETKGAVAPAGAKAAASGLSKVDGKQTVADKASLQTGEKVVEGKAAPTNVKAADGKATPVAAESKAASAIMTEVKTVDNKSALTPSAADGKTIAATAEAKANLNATAPDGSKAAPSTAQTNARTVDVGTVVAPEVKVSGVVQTIVKASDSHADFTVSGKVEAKATPAQSGLDSQRHVQSFEGRTPATVDTVSSVREMTGASPSTTNDSLRPVTSTNSETEGLRQTAAAQPQREARPDISADNGDRTTTNQSSQKSAPTAVSNMEPAAKHESAPIYHAPTEKTSAAPSVDAVVNRGQPTTSFAQNTVVHASTAYTAPASAPPPVTQNNPDTPNNSAARPSAANETPVNKSEPVFKPVEPVAARPEANASPQNQAAQYQTPETKSASGQGTAATGTQNFVDQNAGKPTAAPTSLVVEPIFDDGRNQRNPEQPIRERPARDQPPAADPVTARQPESPRAETVPINPSKPIGGGVAQPINPPINLNEEPKRNEFKQAAKGACAGCGGGDCAACKRPMSADTNSVKSRFTKLDKG